MDERIETANQVLALFRAQPEVREATLRGSLMDGTPDEYSDIDITIDVSGHDNGQYVYRVLDLMHDNFDVCFHDINSSMVPEWYILNFFLNGVPPFWQVDIVVDAQPHCPSVSRDDLKAIQDPVAHFLKLWVPCFKHLIRDPERNEDEIDRCLISRLSIPGLDGLPAVEKMRAVLDEVRHRADGRFEDFLARCYGICEKETQCQDQV
jgi:predicted nucleotidyltransferase